jgi:hypothetical protein
MMETDSKGRKWEVGEVGEMAKKAVLYKCDICDHYHPWSSRDDSNRYGSPEEYAQLKHISIYKVEVRSMAERLAADMAQLEG